MLKKDKRDLVETLGRVCNTRAGYNIALYKTLRVHLGLDEETTVRLVGLARDRELEKYDIQLKRALNGRLLSI